MRIKIELTEDIIKVLSHCEPVQIGDYQFGIDTKNLFCTPFVTETIARILGKFGEAIEGTENDASGRAFPSELEDYMWGIYDYISNNMIWIEDIIHKHIVNGVKPGTYTCIDREKVWSFEPLL